jgi:hypothetical protein
MNSGRIYSPSPTVRASRVPLYMQGAAQRLSGLGDDTVSFEPTMIDAGSDLVAPTYADPYANYLIPINLTAQPTIEPSMYDPSGGLTAPVFSPIAKPLQLQPSAPSPAAAIAQGSPSIASSIASLFSPSPRVSATPTKTVIGTATPGTSAASFLNQQSIPGVPNTYLLAGAALLLLLPAFAGGGRR